MTVLDLDSEQRCQWWYNAHPELAESMLTAKTKKGLHVYFRSIPLRKRNGDEVDLLCEGACAILPPSPDKEWLKSLNGELPLLNPFEWGLEQFGITEPNNTNVTEHTEHMEQTEHTEAIVIKEKGFIKRVIARTLPQKVGQRNNKIFFFAKALRTEYPDANPKIFRDDVRSWYDLALPNIRTKDFAETWLDFLIAWDNVKYFEGVNPMVIYEQAIKLEPPKTVALNYPDNLKIQNLAVLCREMQKACGNKPFFLSARTAAGLLEISAMQANRYLRLLVREDILTIIEKGGTAETVRKATRYRYIAN